MSAAEKARARELAAEHLAAAEEELTATKTALVANVDDEAALDRREKAQRSRDRAAMRHEAAVAAHEEAVASEEAAAAEKLAAEKAVLISAASLPTVHAEACALIAELVALEALAVEKVKSLEAIVAAADAKMRRATGNGNAQSPFTLTIARETVLERIRLARATRAREHDPNIASWVDSAAWTPNRNHASEEREARGVAQRLIASNR